MLNRIPPHAFERSRFPRAKRGPLREKTLKPEFLHLHMRCLTVLSQGKSNAVYALSRRWRVHRVMTTCSDFNSCGFNSCDGGYRAASRAWLAFFENGVWSVFACGVCWDVSWEVSWDVSWRLSWTPGVTGEFWP